MECLLYLPFCSTSVNLHSKLLRYLSFEEQSVTRTAVEPLPGCRPKAGPQHQDFSFFVASFPAHRGLRHLWQEPPGRNSLRREFLFL